MSLSNYQFDRFSPHLQCPLSPNLQCPSQTISLKNSIEETKSFFTATTIQWARPLANQWTFQKQRGIRVLAYLVLNTKPWWVELHVEVISHEY